MSPMIFSVGLTVHACPGGMLAIWHVCRHTPTFNLVLSTRNAHSMHSYAHAFTRSSIYFQQVPKYGLLCRTLFLCKSLHEWRHLVLRRMLPRVVAVWILNSWDSWQRYRMKGTQGASLLCPSWGWSAMAASQEAWKMCQHVLGWWWTCSLTGLHFPWVWSSVTRSEVLASSWQMFPLLSLIEQILWEHLYQPMHARTQSLCIVRLSLLEPDCLQVSVPPGHWHNFKLCSLRLQRQRMCSPWKTMLQT